MAIRSALLLLGAGRVAGQCCAYSADGSIHSPVLASLDNDTIVSGFYGIDVPNKYLVTWFGGTSGTPSDSPTGSYTWTNDTGTFFVRWFNGVCDATITAPAPLPHPRMCVGHADDMWPTPLNVSHLSPSAEIAIWNQSVPSGVRGTLAITNDTDCSPISMWSTSVFSSRTNALQTLVFENPKGGAPPGNWTSLPSDCSM